LRNARF